MTDIKKGDRVRVVIEGEVDRVGVNGKFRVHVGEYEGHDKDGTFTWAHPATAAIEKIEPPVEVFKPGDVVRRKRFGHIYFIRENGGFINLTDGPREWNHEFRFTSEDYERVNLDSTAG